MTDDAAPEPMPRRLFVAVPVPLDDARKIHAVAEQVLGGERLRVGMRLIDPEDYHLTLAFFPKADPALTENLAALVRLVEWEPIQVLTGALGLYGRSAVGLEVIGDEADFSRLWERMAPPSQIVPDGVDLDAFVARGNSLREEPLAKIILAQGVAEFERHRRSGWNGPKLHLTIARLRDRRQKQPELPAWPVQLGFELGSLCLFESILTGTRAHYRVLAQSAPERRPPEDW